MKDIDINALSDKELVEKLKSMNASKCYKFIRDEIPKNRIASISKDVELYKEFQDIKRESKKMHDYDNKLATTEEVNAGIMVAYNLLVRMIKASNDDIGAQLAKIQKAINRIEEEIRIDPTDWDAEEPQDQLPQDQSQD